MTENKSIKSIIRDRMSVTGEKYMEARRRLMEDKIYTIGFLSLAEPGDYEFKTFPVWDESKTPDTKPMASHKLYEALNDSLHKKYDTRDYRDCQLGWTTLREDDSNLEDYYIKDISLVPRSRYSERCRILYEELTLRGSKALLDIVLPNTDKIIIHDTVSDTSPNGKNLDKYLSQMDEESKAKVKSKLFFTILETEGLQNNGIEIVLGFPNESHAARGALTGGYKEAGELIHKTWISRI